MYKLLQGDCLELMKNIPDESVDLILCDLPYTFKGKSRVTANKWDLPIDDNLLWENYLRIIKPDGAICLFATNPFASYLINNHLKYYKYDWVWEKDNGSNFVHVKHQPFKVHEYVIVFGKAPTTFNKNGRYMKYNPQFREGKPYKVKRSGMTDNLATSANYKRSDGEYDGKRYPRSVLKCNVEKGLHPTQKPVELLEYLIKTYTNEGELVLDNCMGSGSVGVACANTNRDFIGIELDGKYFSIAKERIENAQQNSI